MITREIKIMFGQGLVETTRFTGGANIDGDGVEIAGLRMKNLTDAGCVGAIDLVFLNKNGLEREKQEALERKKQAELKAEHVS